MAAAAGAKEGGATSDVCPPSISTDDDPPLEVCADGREGGGVGNDLIGMLFVVAVAALG